MAETQFAFRENRSSEFLDDDDPLAELARIVGFDPKPAVKAEPAPVAVDDAPAAPAAPEMAAEPDWTESTPEWAVDDQVEAVADESDLAPAADPQPAPHVSLVDAAAPMQPEARPSPVFDLEDELLKEFELYDAPRQAETSLRAPEPLAAPAEPPRVEPVMDLSEELEQALGTSFAESVAAPPVAQPEPKQKLTISIRPASQASTMRLPLANFHVARPAEPAAPSVEAPVVEPEPVAAVPSVDQGYEPVFDADSLMAEIASVDEAERDDRWSADDVPAFDRLAGEPEEPDLSFDEPEPMVAVEPEPVAPAYEAAFAPTYVQSVETQASERREPELDDLMNDVASYPIPSAPRAETRPALPEIDLSALENFGRATARVEAPQMRVEPPVSAPVETAPRASEPSFDLPELDLVPAVEAAPEPVQPEDQDFNFDLDLDDFEMELQDIAAETPEPVRAAPAPVQAALLPPVFEPAPAPVYRAPEPVRAPPQRSIFDAAFDAPRTEAPRPAPEPVRPVAPVVQSERDFDPSMFADADDPLETIPELSVPTLPQVEVEERKPTPPDYDIDIDAEMASLLTGSAAADFRHQAQASEPPEADGDFWNAAASAKVVQKPAVTEQPAAAPVDDFEAFERALEDDFRRSLSMPLGQDQYATEDDDYAEPVAARRSFPIKRIAMGAGAATVVLLLGYGAWSYLAGGSAAIVSSEPRVITADKEPVKVVPENKGGKTVPNQDKAVYDRVAGNDSAAPKQESLVTSNEEPVDVVQKTLIPEAQPVGGADAPLASTPVGDTADARLLPSDEADGPGETAAANDAGDPAVAPRKVRTMIVKPDGTMVAREVEAPAEAPVPVEVQQPALASPTSVAGDAASSGPTQQAAADLRAANPDTATGASAEALQAVADSPVAPAQNSTANEPPVRVVKTTNVATPVPSARPADQPVNVVGTVTENGNVRPAAAAAEAPAAPAPVAETPAPAAVETAAVAPGGYVMQIASLPSEAEAQKSYQSLSKKFGSVIGGRGVDIKRADVAGKGTFYRVRIPAGSKAEAVALCEQYRSAGGSCLVGR